MGSYFNKICVLSGFQPKVVKLHTQGRKNVLECKIWACFEKLTVWEVNILRKIVSLQPKELKIREN